MQGKVSLTQLTLPSEELKKYSIGESDDKESGLPNYWLQALKNSKFFAINDKDEKILAHLKNIKLLLNENKLDYSIEFIFDKNEYFAEEKLVKSFVYDEKIYEPIKQIGTNIVWSGKDKNPTIKTKTKKIKSNYFFFLLVPF